jgi:MATE family multidrug resistance protein
MGLGLQGYASVLTFFCYYLIGMPLAWWLAFNLEYGVRGLWIASTVTGLLQDIGYYFIISRCDWKQVASDVKQQLK